MSALTKTSWWGLIALIAVASFLFYEEGQWVMPLQAHELAQFAVLLVIFGLAAVWFRVSFILSMRQHMLRRPEQPEAAQQLPLSLPDSQNY